MKRRNAVMVALLSVAMGVAQANPPAAWAQTSDAQAIVKSTGTIKTINGNALTLAPASGPEVAVTIEPTARLIRLAPGDKDLKNATPIQLGDLKVGDTIRARGHALGSGIDALEILVITSSSVDAVKEQTRQDWEKRGMGGIVDSVEVPAGNINLSIPGLTGKKTLVVHTAKNTVIYRYSPDSPKPEDARSVTLQDIHVGDQLRVLGNRNADGTEVTAEQIYTGIFPSFDATIKSIDASAGTLTVQDLKTKKTVELKITKDSQLHQVPAEMAQRFAGFLKMAKSGALPAGGGSGSASGPAGSGPARSASGPGGAGAGAGGGGMGGGGRFGGGGGFDFQRRLDQTPPVALANLHKGDAISVLTTEGTPGGGSTVIKMFSGVEPILEAAPSGSQAMMLTPWTLGGAPGGEAAQ